MKNMMTQAAPPPPQPTGTENQGDLAAVHIDPAANGYDMHAHFDPDDQQKGFPKPSKTVHGNRQDLLDHLDDVLARHEARRKGKKKA